MRHVNAMFGFAIWMQISENSFVTLQYTRNKGALPRQQILGQKLLYMHFWRDNENVMTYNRAFRGEPIQRRHFKLHGSKGHCHGNQSLAKLGKKSHKNGHNFSCVRHIHAHQFGFEIRFMYQNYALCINEFTCGTPIHKRQNSVTMATKFGTKIAINVNM